MSHSEIVLRGIPDKFEEAIVFCFVVNHDGRLVDLAPNSDNVSTNNRRRVTSWNCLGSCVTLIRAYAWSSCCRWICAGAWRRSALSRLTGCVGLARCAGLSRRPRLSWTARSIQGIRGSANSTSLGKLEILAGFETSNQLTGGTHIDKSPRTVFFVHGIFVRLAHEAQRTNFRFGEVVERSGKPAHFPVVEFDATGVLLAAPDHFFFFFTAAFSLDIRCNRHRGNKQKSDQENDHKQSIAALAALPQISLARGIHCGAACSSTRGAVPRSPVDTSSYSRLVLPILRMRKRLSRSSPSLRT